MPRRSRGFGKLAVTAALASATASLRKDPGDLRPEIMTFSELNRPRGREATPQPIAPDRDFLVVNADALAATLRGEIRDPEVAALPLVGAVDQFSDSVDLLESPLLAHRSIAGMFA